MPVKTLDRRLSPADRQRRDALLVRRRSRVNQVILAAVELARVDAELATLGGPPIRRRPIVMLRSWARDLPIGLTAIVAEVRL